MTSRPDRRPAERSARPWRGIRRIVAAFLAAFLLVPGAAVEAQRVAPYTAPGGGGVHTPGVYPGGSSGLGDWFGHTPRARSPQERNAQRLARAARQPADAAQLLADARRLHEANRADFSRPEAFLDGLPSFRVRLPASTRVYDEVLKEEARRLYAGALNAPLNAGGIWILEADFSPRADVQAQASQDFRARVPAARLFTRDSLGPLRRDGYPTPAPDAIARVLAPFRGQVLILVGHIDPASHSMRWDGGDEPIEIPIEDWAYAARQAGVVLLPLGCHSSSFSPLGSSDALNSAVIARNLAAMLASPPANVGEMFALLTMGAAGQPLALDIDPFEATLAHDRIDIVNGERIEGEIHWTPRLLDPARSGGGESPDCLARPGYGAYRACLDIERDAAAIAAAADTNDLDREWLGDGRRDRWLRLGIFFAMILVAGLPLGLYAREEEAAAPAGGKPPPGFASSYGAACMTLGMLHLIGLGVLLVANLFAMLALIAAGFSMATLLWQAIARRSGGPLWGAIGVALSGAAYFWLILANQDLVGRREVAAVSQERLEASCRNVSADVAARIGSICPVGRAPIP